MTTIHNTDRADELLKSLQRIEDLLVALVKSSPSATLREQIPDKNYQDLYDLTGKFPVKKLTQKTGFSVGKISGIWQKWEQSGLLVKDGGHYRKTL